MIFGILVIIGVVLILLGCRVLKNFEGEDFNLFGTLLIGFGLLFIVEGLFPMR